MKFLIFAANLTLVLSLPEPQLEDQPFIIGIRNLDSVRLQLPKDKWHLHGDFNDSFCELILKSVWIFPENYSDISRRPPFGMIHRQTRALDVGTLILYYDNNREVIPAFCCQHDENMAIYVTYNMNFGLFTIFRKTSTRIDDLTMTPGIVVHGRSYEETVTLISWCFINPINYTDLIEATELTEYCLWLFWRLSRYQMEGHEAFTIISELSGNTLNCQSFLFAEGQNGNFQRYNMHVYIDSARENYRIILKDDDGVDLVTFGRLKQI